MIPPLLHPKLKVGDIVRLKERGRVPYLVLGIFEHAVRVKEWPVADAPPAEEVLRSEIVGQEGEGDE